MKLRNYKGKLLEDKSWYQDETGRWRRVFHEYVWFITHENPHVRVLSHMRLKLSVRNKASFKGKLKILREHEGGLLVTYAGRALSHFAQFHPGFRVTRVCRVDKYKELYPAANPIIEYVGSPKTERDLYAELFDEEPDEPVDAED